MMQSFEYALLISLAGMGLIFLLIILLWGFMALLTRLFIDKEVPKDMQQKKEDITDKQRAAILAVSIALAKESADTPHEFPLPPTALVSAWQAVMRSNIITKRGRIR
jgi:Na+-transporting methylmalonyl-CoA/oxaloacetate decarboxylase gamma subunit